MDLRLQRQCDLLVQNKHDMEKAFKWDSSLLACAAAEMFACKGMAVPVESLLEAREILKQHAGIFSELRGTVRLVILTQMVLSGHAELFLNRVQETYRLINRHKVFDNTFKLLAAVLIAADNSGTDTHTLVDRTREIYENMRSSHRFLTSTEDIPFAAILALSGQDARHIAEESEAAFAILRARFRHVSGNLIQSLSHVLSADPAPAAEKCEKVIALYDALKARKCRLGTGYEWITLGTLLIPGMSADRIADAIVEADAYLKTKKGFSNFSMGANRRRMYAAQTVLDVSLSDPARKDALLGSMVALTVSQQIAVMLLLAGTAASSAAVSGSAH